MKLRYKISIIIISLSIITIILPGIFYFQFSKNLLEKQINNYLTAELTKNSYEIEGWLKTHAQIVATISDIISTSFYREDITSDLLTSYINNKDISDIYIGFDNGSFISGGGWIPPADYDPRIRSWYIEATATENINISTIYSDMTTGKDAVSIGKNLTDKSGKIIGVIAEDVLVETLYKKINSIKLDNGGYAFLSDKNGKILVHPDSTLINKNMLDLVEINSPSQTLNTSNRFETYIYNNQKKLIMLKDINGTNWKIALVIPKETAYRPLSSLLSIYFFVTLASIFAATIISFILDRNIVTRLKTLSVASNELKNGKFDIVLKDLAHDEIGEVSEAFNRMRETLKKTFFELDWIAYHDVLTQLPNRQKLIVDMEKLIAEHKKNNHSFAVIFTDLDDFKNVNDILGYATGDLLLKNVGEILSKEYSA